MQLGQLRRRLGGSPQRVELGDVPRFVELHVRDECLRRPREPSDQLLILVLEHLVAEALKDAGDKVGLQVLSDLSLVLMPLLRYLVGSSCQRDRG